MNYLNSTGLERLWVHILSKLNYKVNKVEGKGLSTEDFTTEEKEKLASLQSIDIVYSDSDNPPDGVAGRIWLKPI